MNRWRLVVAMVLGLAVTATAQPRETVAVISEIKPGKGKVEIKSGASDWRPAGALQALRSGDQVRTSGDATVVVLLSGGRGTTRIDAATSPWMVPSIAADGKAQKAQALVASSIAFLSSGTKEPPKAVAATRSLGVAPVILTPRAGSVLANGLVFEWMGSQFSRYTVRVASPDGVVVEKAGVVGARFTYPADAPPLEAGVPYRFEVQALGHPVQTTTFDVVDASRARAIAAELRELDLALAGATPNSITVAKAGSLASAGLLHDARLLVLAAITRDPDEPTLHAVLGHLYRRTGLDRQAAESFEEAQFLLSRDR